MNLAPALVTTALPYANGPLHLGHLVGYVQADIWVRARRMDGGLAHFVCADDAHGTPIMLAAEKAGQTPEDFIRAIQAGHERDFAAFGVAFDHYHSTHSPENQALANLVYGRLRDGGAIARRSIQQLYDPTREMFLILGADALEDLPTWKNPQRICELALPLVVCRAYAPEPDFSVLVKFQSHQRIAAAQAAQVSMPPIGIASSDIRRRVATGRSIRFRTPRAVEKYIETHGLYRTEP